MMNATKKRVKGFTLVEMIVVIAILVILLGIITPNLLSTYRKSRINSANADAKMIYNGVQTEVVNYINKDRVAADADKSGFNNTLWISYEPGVGVKFSKLTSMTTDSMKLVTASDIPDADKVLAQTAKDVADKVNRVVSGAQDVSWAVCVNNYIVKACVSATSTSSNCVGYYSANKAHAEGYSDRSYKAVYVDLLSDYTREYTAKYNTSSDQKR